MDSPEPVWPELVPPCVSGAGVKPASLSTALSPATPLGVLPPVEPTPVVGAPVVREPPPSPVPPP